MAELLGHPQLQLQLPDFLMRKRDRVRVGIEIICCRYCGCGTEIYAPGFTHYGLLSCPFVVQNHDILPEHILPAHIHPVVLVPLQNLPEADPVAVSSTCCVCLGNNEDMKIFNIYLPPCNHVCLCNDCIDEYSTHSVKCPMCRSYISSYKPISHALPGTKLYTDTGLLVIN